LPGPDGEFTSWQARERGVAGLLADVESGDNCWRCSAWTLRPARGRTPPADG